MDIRPEGPDPRTLSERCDAVAEGRDSGSKEAKLTVSITP